MAKSIGRHNVRAVRLVGGIKGLSNMYASICFGCIFTKPYVGGSYETLFGFQDISVVSSGRNRLKLGTYRSNKVLEGFVVKRIVTSNRDGCPKRDEPALNHRIVTVFK